MSFPVYNGQINQVKLGDVTLGGNRSLPFYEKGLTPKYAYEIIDSTERIASFPKELKDEWGDVLESPALWAKEAEKRGCQAICLTLTSTDPNGEDKSADEALKIIGEVLENVTLPVIVWGTSAIKKDEELLSKAIEKFGDKIYAVGPVQQENYKTIAQTAKGTDIMIIASTPVDVNMAKQLNIMLENEGVARENILIDPVVSAIGYGIEYCYSVMERIRTAALMHNDQKLQNPMVCNIGGEAWKVKEASAMNDDKMGGDGIRGVMWEATSAAMLATAGADLIIMRSPRAKELMNKLSDKFSDTFNGF